MQSFRIWEIVDIAFSIFSLFGLFSFAWRRAARVKMWKAFFFIVMVWTFTYQFIIPMPLEAAKLAGNTSQLLLASINILPFLPMLWALYRLGFRTMDNSSNVG